MDMKKIAEAFRLLADAIDPKNEPEAPSKPSKGKQTRKKPDPAPDEAPSSNDPIELETLQRMAAKILKADGREALMAVLEANNIKSVSSADEAKYPQIYADLVEAGGL